MVLPHAWSPSLRKGRSGTSTCVRSGHGWLRDPLHSLDLEVDFTGPVPAGFFQRNGRPCWESHEFNHLRHDLRGHFGPAREQGLRPTCLAFATSDAHAAVRDTTWADSVVVNTSTTTPCSGEGVSHTSGVKIASIRDALDQDGQPMEAGWPYLKCRPEELEAAGEGRGPVPPGVEDARGQLRQGVAEGDIRHAGLDRHVHLRCLLPTRRLAWWTRPSRLTRPGGTRSSPLPRVSCPGRRLLMVRNSWGAGWGLAGYAWIAERYMKPRIMEMVTIN